MNEKIIIPYVVLIVVLVAGALMNPLLLKGTNIGNLFEQVTAVGIASIGQMLVMLLGGIDLSIGSVISLTVSLLSVLMDSVGIAGSLVIVIAVGALIGFLNGIGTAKFKIPPFVMTLGMMSIAAGAALKVRPIPGGSIDYRLSDFLNDRIGVFPVAFLFLIVLFVFFYILLKRTRFGRNIYAVGGNEQSAALSGIRVDRVKIAVYTLTGILGALAGIYLAARMGTGDPNVGKYYTMDSITIAVLGGIHLLGGRGSIVGIFASMFVLITLNNVLNLVGVSSFYQYVMKGAILLLVVALYALRGRKNVQEED